MRFSGVVDSTKRMLLSLGVGKPPVAFHSFWTRPSINEPEIPDFEVLTIVVGILSYKDACQGEFRLYSDDQGIRLFEKLGIISLYDSVNRIIVKPEIDPKMFWAAGKIQAYSMAPVPFVSMDFDAYVLKPFWRKNMYDAMPLNPEPVEWECYRNNEKEFSNFISIDPADWSGKPFNVGVLGMFNSKLRAAYIDCSMRFMSDYSRFGNPPKKYYENFETKSGVSFFGEMVFAEQRLLDIVARNGNFNVSPITEFDLEGFKCKDNDFATHLWTKKKLLKTNDAARKNYILKHINWLIWNHPEVISTLYPEILRIYENLVQ